MISQRDAFFNSLFELAKDDKRIIVISADMGAPSLDQWRFALPHQFINVGVAEQNAVNVATGMALSGFLPFVYAIAPFISLRVVEQIKIGPALHRLPVTLVGIGAGLSYADAGPTHHNIEDLRIISSIPNMTVITCSDSAMASVIPYLSLREQLPFYIRLDRDTNPSLHPHISVEDLQSEYPIKKMTEQPYYVISCGDLFYLVHSVCVDNKINCGDVFRIPVLPSLKDKIPRKAKLLVMEEGVGLGSALLEYTVKHHTEWEITQGVINSYKETYGGRELMRDDKYVSQIIKNWRNGIG